MCVWRRSKNMRDLCAFGGKPRAADSVCKETERAAAKCRSCPSKRCDSRTARCALSTVTGWPLWTGMSMRRFSPRYSGYMIKQDYREGSVVQSGEVLF